MKRTQEFKSRWRQVSGDVISTVKHELKFPVCQMQNNYLQLHALTFHREAWIMLRHWHPIGFQSASLLELSVKGWRAKGQSKPPIRILMANAEGCVRCSVAFGLDESLFATATRPLSHGLWQSQLCFLQPRLVNFYFGIPHANFLFLRTENEKSVWFPIKQ